MVVTSVSGLDNELFYKISSAKGESMATLPTGDKVPVGSKAMDCTTDAVYQYDGVTWHEM